uniref:Uncharacterized protein n=1 Tax=Cyprinodon variegatus TaxID=28743 RepID=A0A3Q2CWS7_CYPVA
MPICNPLSASSFLSQQYAAALGVGPVLPDLHFRRGPMVEKAVQTIKVEGQRRGLIASQDRQWNRRRRSSGRAQLMVANVPSPILKFDTDFDFDSANAQFIKEVEREVQERRNLKADRINQCWMCSAEYEDFGPKCYYDKAKSFFDNSSVKILEFTSCSPNFRLSWAEERKRNLETFGVTGRFLRGQGFRGRFTRSRGRGAWFSVIVN